VGHVEVREREQVMSRSRQRKLELGTVPVKRQFPAHGARHGLRNLGVHRHLHVDRPVRREAGVIALVVAVRRIGVTEGVLVFEGNRLAVHGARDHAIVSKVVLDVVDLDGGFLLGAPSNDHEEGKE